MASVHRRILTSAILILGPIAATTGCAPTEAIPPKSERIEATGKPADEPKAKSAEKAFDPRARLRESKKAE